MEQVHFMDNKAFLFIILFSVGLQALKDTEAKIIRNEVNVCEHDQAILPCGGSSDSRHRWKVRILTGQRKGVPNDPFKYGHNNSSLIVKNIQEADTKKLFYCHTYSTIHHYRVTYIYNLKIICEDLDVYNGSQLALYCKVDIPDNDIQKIEWKFRAKHQGKAKTISPRATKGRITMAGRILNITNVTKEDCGMLTCLVSRKTLGLSRARYFYNIFVIKAPKTTTFPSQTMMPTTDKTTKRAVQTTVQSTTGGTIAKTITFPEKPSTTKLSPFPTNNPSSAQSNTKETLQNEHSTDPTIENVNDKVQRTLSPKQKTTSGSIAVNSDNENQRADESTTLRSSSGTVASGVALAAYSTLALLSFLYNT